MDEMSIERLSSLPTAGTSAGKPAGENLLGDFKKILTESVGDVNRQLFQADEDVEEMIAGTKDIHEAMISMEKANISMRLLLQVRNKIISAYEEIMRMQF